MIGIAGGAIVRDIIQRGYNLDADMHLMDGPTGASTKKMEQLHGHDYGFKTIEELLGKLYSKNPEIFGPDFSLDKMEAYIQNAKNEIEMANKATEQEEAVPEEVPDTKQDEKNKEEVTEQIPEETSITTPKVTPKNIADADKKEVITTKDLEPLAKSGIKEWFAKLKEGIKKLFR